MQLGSEDATQCLVVGNAVYDPLLFQPKLVRFSRKQYQFLHAYRLGVPLEEAATKAELSLDSIKRFLSKPDTVAWLEDRALKDHIKCEWEEPGKWWHLGNEVLEGRKQFNKAQIVIFQEFGQRIVPKKQGEGPGGTKIEININPQAVKEAFLRQDAIEGELA